MTTKRGHRTGKPKRRRLKGPIHQRITELREAKGWNQQQFADVLDIDKSAVNHWERGWSRPDLSRLSMVAEKLGVTVAELVEGEPAFAVLLEAA